MCYEKKFNIRDIPIFDDMLEHNKSVYKAKNVDEFELLIKKFFNNEIESVVEEAYKIAKPRGIKEVGKQLKEIYEEIMEQDYKN